MDYTLGQKKKMFEYPSNYTIFLLTLISVFWLAICFIVAFFFKNKFSDLYILIREERSKERKCNDEYYLKEIERIRGTHHRNLRNMEDRHVEQIQRTKLKVTENFVNEIKSLQKNIKEKEKIIRENQKAWNIIKDFLPRAIRLANVLKVNAEVNRDCEIKSFQKVASVDGELELLGMFVDKMTPKIDKYIEGKKTDG